MAKKKKAARVKVETIRHKDKRTNIPTEELRDFVAEEEHAPPPKLYERDPSLDPQLVWKGKDEQDRQPLSVPVVPIYIQEKIHPQAIIDALPRAAVAEDPQQNLFADFNGGPAEFDQKVDFYHHEQNWTNRMILGDSLLVMTSLAEKEGLKGMVQTIYLDPPYGIKFGSNWQVSTRKRDVKDGKAEDATRQPEQVRAFRDTWELGVHSYLAYLRDRLVAALDLLTETGSVFVQIGDENVHLVRCLMDEVFQSDNFVASIVVRKTAGQTSDLLSGTGDYILWYAKSKENVKFRPLFTDKLTSDSMDRYDQLELQDGTRRAMTAQEKSGIAPLPDGSRRYQPSATTSTKSPGSFPVPFEGKTYLPKSGFWKTGLEGFSRLAKARRLVATSGGVLRYIRYAEDFPSIEIDSIWSDIYGSVQSRSDPKVYVVQTGTAPVQRCLLMTTDPGDLVLDPTCGAGTTAYVAEQWARRWITIDTSRVALALARTRLMAAKYSYYLLADSPEGRKKEEEVVGGQRLVASSEETSHKSQATNHSPHHPDIRKGFVYKRVPHVTLKSIANNPDIKEGMTRAQIDAAIAKHADTETLFDQPYEDNGRVRVCGPFSVESLSPHRTISIEEKKLRAEGARHNLKVQVLGPDKFGQMILDNLRKAGVQNTVKKERLKFDTLDFYAGEWIHGQGTYTESDGGIKRVAVCIGPEHGTVGATLVKEAAKEAVKGVGFDVLIICGFAFDPSVSEEAKRYGKLTVLVAKMNPDLAMGDELLKKTGAGNLFMVFGEPDVEVVSGQWLVAREGRLVARYEQVKELSGAGSLEEINRLGGSDLRSFKKLSGRGKVRADKSDTPRGGVRSVEHRRGSGAEWHGGIPAIPQRGKRVAGGSRDATDSGPENENDNARSTGEAAGASGRDRQDAERAQTLTAFETLNSSDFPLSLTTSHYAQVTIHGLDVYDPTTGDVRSHDTDDIACWFIDTEYNGESFFVRHAYFTGADEPYEKLKRALRAEIDEAAWSSLYSTVSRPFPPPTSGKIAVKVINHFGDEVLKVFSV